MTSRRESDVTYRKQPSIDDVIRCALVIAAVTSFVFKTGDAIVYLGNDAIWRENEDLVKRAIYILEPTHRVQSKGTLVGWDVYTTRGRRSQVVFLQIWRPINGSSDGRRYTRTGETRIAALWVGHSRFLLYPVDRIPVRSGDVMGIWFPNYNPIPFSVVPCEREGSEHLSKHNPQLPQNEMTFEMTFDPEVTDSNTCRRYSVNATIMNDDELKLFDYDYQETTDGRYDKRPYGNYALFKRFVVCCQSTSLWRQTPPAAVPLVALVAMVIHRLLT